jgi:hypothetical protein
MLQLFVCLVRQRRGLEPRVLSQERRKEESSGLARKHSLLYALVVILAVRLPICSPDRLVDLCGLIVLLIIAVTDSTSSSVLYLVTRLTQSREKGRSILILAAQFF